ncbi:MAG TPA: peptidoglycan recognition family protein [Solirubrobacterales bacterium]|nr:peptidoglycan recognition family protein [Solirubrobacterales bacterium]
MTRALLTAVVAAAVLFGAAAEDGSPRASTAGATAEDSRPQLQIRPIPFGPKRKREMAAYSARHYGERTWRLRRPRVIVQHMAQAATVAAVYNTFAPDKPDPELGELPNVCAHFVVSRKGRIFRLVNLRTRCRHTIGLNWTAIGIEHVGYGDGDALGNRRQLRASLRLTRWLRCRYRIRIRDVIGHRESLRSPYHRERVASLRNRTHGDWRHASMRVYRQKLRKRGRCPA